MGSKPLATRLREKRNHPPPGQPWVWLSREILESEAWRTAPINTRRVVDRLMLEHMAHAGTMNGKLVCTYDDFQKWGIGRRYLSASIANASQRGLIALTEKGRASAGENRWPNKYALGWLPMYDGAPALNKWKSWTPKSNSPGAPLSTGERRETANSLVAKGEPAPVHKRPLAKPRFSIVGPSAQRDTTYNILGGRGEAGTDCQSDARVTAPPDRTLENQPSKEGSNNFGPFKFRRWPKSLTISDELRAVLDLPKLYECDPGVFRAKMLERRAA